MKILTTSDLRNVNSTWLKAMKEPHFITVRENGVSEIQRVLVPYELYMKWQEMYLAGEKLKATETP